MKTPKIMPPLINPFCAFYETMNPKDRAIVTEVLRLICDRAMDLDSDSDDFVTAKATACDEACEAFLLEKTQNDIFEEHAYEAAIGFAVKHMAKNIHTEGLTSIPTELAINAIAKEMKVAFVKPEYFHMARGYALSGWEKLLMQVVMSREEFRAKWREAFQGYGAGAFHDKADRDFLSGFHPKD